MHASLVEQISRVVLRADVKLGEAACFVAIGNKKPCHFPFTFKRCRFCKEKTYYSCAPNRGPAR